MVFIKVFLNVRMINNLLNSYLGLVEKGNFEKEKINKDFLERIWGTLNGFHSLSKAIVLNGVLCMSLFSFSITVIIMTIQLFFYLNDYCFRKRAALECVCPLNYIHKIGGFCRILWPTHKRSQAINFWKNGLSCPFIVQEPNVLNFGSIYIL